ncbi:MAG: Gfo/Idh/MocA family protein [Acutalibacteraceae bacterium]
MLKVGLVGVGGISGNHIPAWEEMENAELTALCDVRPERLEMYPGKRHYTDFEEMLKSEQLDILDICLPTYLHADYAVRALERGIHVLCEKPISLKEEDVDRIYSTAEKNNVKFMVAHVLRFWPEYAQIKDIADSQRYGKLLSGRMTRVSEIPRWSWDGWMTDEERSGLVPFDLHIHDLDFMVYAFGKPTSVKTVRVKRPDQDSLSAIYEYDGAFISAESAWYAPAVPFIAEFRFQFEKAVLIFDGQKLTAHEIDGTKRDLSSDSQAGASAINLPKTNAYANEIVYFADCVANGKPVDKVKPEELKTVLELLNQF